MGGRRQLLLSATTPEKRRELERLLLPSAEKWSAIPTFKSGPELLDLVGRQRIDAVLFHTPDCDDGFKGTAQLLAASAPELQRIVLCARAEDREVLRSLPGLPPIILSPDVSPVMLEDRLTQAFVLQHWLSRSGIRMVLPRIKSLPTFPATYQRVFEMVQDPDASTEELARVIATDPSLTAQLLKVVNSPLFAGFEPVGSIREAVMRLGGPRMQALITSAHAWCFIDEDACRGFSPSEEWRHCVAVAILARDFARQSGAHPDIQEMAFTAGILHDLGKLLLAANLPDRYAIILEESLGRGLDIATLESQQLEVSHAELGACLLGVWGLPLPILEAVAWHHQPSLSPRRGSGALPFVHVANCIVRRTKPDAVYLSEVGVDPNRLQIPPGAV